MPIKNPVWLLFIIAILALLGFYKYVAWEVVIGFFIIYIFSLGLLTEIEEIKAKESLKYIITRKIENIEKLLTETLQKIDSDTRIKERLSKRKKEIIKWLDKL